MMSVEISDLDEKIIKEIQEDIPLAQEPFQKIANKLELSKEKLLERLEKLKEKGAMRRISAILYHRRSGYRFNGMGVWIVPEEKREQVGKLMAAYQEISHVYERPTYPDWPYSLFSMIHGQSKEEVEEVAEDIYKKAEVTDYTILYSTEELKKTSMRYFQEEGLSN
jgi:DNA-binding Lrp family transcriptional regulator